MNKITISSNHLHQEISCTRIIVWITDNRNINQMYCVKSGRIRSYSAPHFPTFGLNTERYGVFLRIQSECGKIQTRITPNTDTKPKWYVYVKRVAFLTSKIFSDIIHEFHFLRSYLANLIKQKLSNTLRLNFWQKCSNKQMWLY